MFIASIIDNLNANEKDVIKVLLKNPNGLSLGEISQGMRGSLSSSTISRLLQKMRDQKIVEKTGSTRSAQFKPSEQAKYWMTPYHLRSAVYFSDQRFNDYIPNQTKWLSGDVREKMNASITTHTVLDASTYSRSIAERFLIDLAWASSSLEGNTYSLLETETLVKYGEMADTKSAQDAVMIINHKNAIAIMLEEVQNKDITTEIVQKIHTFMMRDLLNVGVLGKIRQFPVRISSTSYIPSDNNIVLRQTLGSVLYKASEINDPFEAMFFIAAGISYLQPFEDGNKRMGRLLCNLPLLRAGYPPLSFISVNKRDYIQGLLEFYELGETGTFGKALGEGYVSASHVYQNSTQSQRTPRSIELRRRHDINEVMQKIILEKVVDEEKIKEIIIQNIKNKDFGDEEKIVFLDVIKEYYSSLNEDNIYLFSVSKEAASEYLFFKEKTKSDKKMKM